jgi:hypothetical protein
LSDSASSKCGNEGPTNSSDIPTRATTVPVHAGRDISPILLRQICRDIGVAVDDFLAS